MIEDPAEAIGLYRHIIAEGGWTADDDIEREVRNNGVPGGLRQAKHYREQRSVERQSYHSEQAKRRLAPNAWAASGEWSRSMGPALPG